MLKNKKAKMLAIFLAIVLVITGTNIVSAFATEPDLIDDSISESSKKTLGDSDKLALGASLGLATFAANDITVNISNSAPLGYQSYTNSSHVAPPPLITSFNVHIKKANIKNAKIELDFISEKGYLGTDFFKFDKIGTLPGNTIFDGVPTVDPVTGKVTVKIKDDVALNSSESISIYHNYNTAQYDGAAPPETVLANASAKAFVGSETVFSTASFSVKSQSSIYPSITSEYFFPILEGTLANPEEVLNDDTLTVRQRINNNEGYFKNKFDPSVPVVLKAYYPNGTTSATTPGFAQNVTVGAAEAAAAGIPAGVYTVYTKTVGTDGKTGWSQFNYDGNLNLNFDQVDVNFTLPPNSDGMQFEIYRVLSYKHLGADNPTYKKMSQHVKVNQNKGWDMYWKNTHATGISRDGSSGMENGDVGNAVVRTGYGYGHSQSSKNQGSVNTTGVEFNLYQMGSGPQRVNFNTINFHLDKKNDSIPNSTIKYWFVIGSDKGQADYPTTPVTSGLDSTFALNLPTLDQTKGEYIKEVHVVPISKVGGTDTEGIWPPGTALRFSYDIKAWNNKVWPNGTAITNVVHSIPLAYKIDYVDANTSQKTFLQGATAIVKYVPGTSRPEVRGVAAPGTSPGALEPGDSVVYRLNGLNNNINATKTWDDATIIVRFPAGITIEDTSNLRFMDATGADKGQATVTDSGVVNGSYYYRIQAPDGYKIPLLNSTSFYIDLPLKLPTGIPEGKYQPEFVLTEKNSTNFNAVVMDPIPGGQTRADYGLGATEKFTYFKYSGQAEIGVVGSSKMSSNSKIKSPATGGLWDDAETVAADFDEIVGVQLNIVNEGNRSLGGFRLYDIIPYGGYLGSSATCNITLENVNAPGGTVWYYVGATPPGLDEIKTIATPSAGWTTTKPSDSSTIKAFLVDFGATKLATDQTLTVELDFKVPPESSGEQLAFNKFSYTTGEVQSNGTVPVIEAYESPKQGFSTSSYSIRYMKNFPTEVANWPDNQTGIFVLSLADKLTVTSQEPTRPGYTFKEWNDAADGSGKAWLAGEVKQFITTDSKLELYDIWEVDSNTTIDVTYKLAGGNVGGSTADVIQTGKVVGNTLTFPNAVRAGYILEGFYRDVTDESTKWNTTDTITGADIVANGITLTAKWTIDNTQKVLVKYATIDAGNVSGMPASTVKYSIGETIPNPPDPVRPGYKLTGWNYNGTAWNFATTINSSHFGGIAPNYEMTLDAVWEVDPAQTISVTYDLNGGNVAGNTANIIQTGKKVEDTLITPVPTRVGYDFVGFFEGAAIWNTGDKITIAHMQAGGLALKAQWTANTTDKLTVKFKTVDAANVTGMPPDVIKTAGQAIAEPPAPVRPGYKLTGWNYGLSAWNFTTLIDTIHFGGTAPNYEMTLDAVWEVDNSQTINVIYDLNGGNIGGSTVNPTENGKVVGSTLTLPAPSRTGYTFDGWYEGATKWTSTTQINPTHMSAGSLTLVAKWTVDGTATVDVTFDLNGGNIAGSTVNPTDNGKVVESTLTFPTEPTRVGYDFDGWFRDITDINSEWELADKVTSADIAGGDFTLTAKWIVDYSEKVTVNFTTDDPSNVTNMPSNQSIAAGQTIAEPSAPVRPGYKLTGWNYGLSAWNFTTPLDTIHFGGTAPNYTMTLKAVWEVDASQTINVTYDLNGGNIGGSTVNPTENGKVVGSTLTFPAPSRIGYTLDGWYEGATKWTATTQINSTHMSAGSLTLVAKWTVNTTETLTVNFTTDDAANVTGMPPSVTRNAGQTITEPADPTRAGYKLKDWNYNNAAWNFATVLDTIHFGGTAPNYTMTLKALWEVDNSQTINATFKLNGGNIAGNTADVIDSGKHVEDTLVFPGIPVKTGYVFAGWYKDITDDSTIWSATDKITSVEMEAGSITLTAKWDKDNEQKVTVKFVTVDASNVTGMPAEVRKAVGETITEPTKPTRPGYILTGWNYGGSAWNFATQIDTIHFGATLPYTMTLDAVWAIDPSQTIDVTFDLNGGNIGGSTVNPTDTGKKVEDTLIFPTVPTKIGYTFNGWYENVDVASTKWTATTKINSTHMQAGGLKLTAKWDVNTSETLTVKFVTVDPASVTGMPANETRYAGQTITSPTAPVRAGYKLTGWNYGGSLWNFATKIDTVHFGTTMPYEMILNAVWAIDDTQTINVTFDLNGGQVGGSTANIVEKNKKAEEGLTLHTPIKAGYAFDGWYRDITNPATQWVNSDKLTSADIKGGDFTLKAKWSIDPTQAINITLDLNGGNIGGSTVNPVLAAKNVEDTIILPVPVREGHTFEGWFLGSNKWNSGTKLTSEHMAMGNFTLTANWKVIQYTLTFDSNGGSATGNITGDYNSKVKLPEITRLAYVLDGWYNAADVKVGVAGQDYTITKNETLKAKWLKITYTLISEKNVIVDVDDKYPPKSNALTIDEFLKVANVSTTASVGTTPKALPSGNSAIGGEPTITSPDIQKLDYSKITAGYDQNVTFKFEWVTGQVETITVAVKVVDRVAPVITLNDSQRFEINIVDKKGELKSEAELLAYMIANGLKVIDNYDGEVAPIISFAEGSFASINWKEPGEYGIYIDAVDSSDNKAEKKKAAAAVVMITTDFSDDRPGSNDVDTDSKPNTGNGNSDGRIPQTGGGGGGNSFDNNGNLVDSNGNKIADKNDLPRGSKINGQGQLIDAKGNVVNLNGLSGGKLPTTGIAAGGSSIGLLALLSLLFLAKKKKNKEDENQL